MGMYYWRPTNTSAMRSRHSAGVRGPRSAAPPQPMPIRHGFWANYGTQTLICIGVSQLSVLMLIVGWKELVMTGHVLYIGFLVGTAILTLITPFYFYDRYRVLRAALGEGQGEKTAGMAAGTAAVLARHPNRALYVDGTKVKTAGITLLAMAALQLSMGAYLLFVQSAPLGQVWRVFSVVLLVEGALNAVLGIATLRNSMLAARLAVTVAISGWGAALITVDVVTIALHIGAAVLVWRAYEALRHMSVRVINEEQEDPLIAYYYNLIGLLVWVMRADGHVDRRELRKLDRLVDTPTLSRFERQMVLAQNSGDDRAQEIDEQAEHLLIAARALELSEPGHELIVSALAVAGADGVLAPDEEIAVRKLAAAVEMDEAEIDALISQQRERLDDQWREDHQLDPERARELLGLDEGATPDAVDQAYRQLLADLDPGNFQHLGDGMIDHARSRRRMVERAYGELRPAQAAAE